MVLWFISDRTVVQAQTVKYNCCLDSFYI